MNWRVEKVVLSIGLGGRTPKQILAVKTHMEHIIHSNLGFDRRFQTTRCRRSVALFKIRKNNPIGLKMTFRKSQIPLILKMLVNNKNRGTYKFRDGCVYFSVVDHRLLRLERYNNLAPEYGFSVNVSFCKPGVRCAYRRIRRCELKDNINEDDAFKLIKDVLEQKS